MEFGLNSEIVSVVVGLKKIVGVSSFLLLFGVDKTEGDEDRLIVAFMVLPELVELVLLNCGVIGVIGVVGEVFSVMFIGEVRA